MAESAWHKCVKSEKAERQIGSRRSGAAGDENRGTKKEEEIEWSDCRETTPPR